MASSNKRKDNTPKKQQELQLRKKKMLWGSPEIVDLTIDDDMNEVCNKENKPNHMCCLFKEEPTEVLSHADLQSSSVESTNSDSDSVACSLCLPPLSFYRNDPKLPIYSQRCPNLREIFLVCLRNELPEERYVTQKPVRVKDTLTFVVNQTRAVVKHPKDLDADDTPGAYTKKEQTRFYQVERNKEGDIEISCQVQVTKDDKGNVVSGTYRERSGKKWLTRIADINKVYCVIRKRAVHKATLERYKTAFTRYIMWIMPVKEYNETYANLKNSKYYTLSCPNIIMHYYFNTSKPVPIVASKHGNARDGASSFRPKEHSLKQTCKEIVQEDKRAARHICQEMQASEDILDIFSDSSVVRDPKQVSNYRQNYGRSSKTQNADAVRDIIFMLLEQSSAEEPSVLSKDQPFIQELLVRHGKHVEIVAFLEQTLKDIERFCTKKANPRETSTLCTDTTFNIAEFLVTQTTYQQLSVIRRDNLKHPWFPGPIAFHRDQKQEDFSYFWQAVKRGNPALSGILVLGTDKDKALSEGILQETEGSTLHLLGKEHVVANVQKKLVSLNFPLQQRRVIMQDIFGGVQRVDERDNCLYACESTEEYDVKVASLKVKWNEIEREHTRNSPPNKFSSYFETYKEKQVREKMIKAVRRKANIDGEYGQNPIEWLNFLSKEEIDEFGKPEGHSHRDVTLTTALKALKNRYLRLYANLVKAIYDEGPYMLSTSYSHLIVSYDEWCDMPATEKSQIVKALMTYVPPASLPCPVTGSFSKVTTAEMEPSDGDLQDVDGSFTAPKQIPAPTVPRRLIITAEEANLPVEAIALTSLQDIFKRAEFLLNEPGAVMKAASNEERMRTVKSRYGEDPLIVKPQKKNKNLFECNCKMFKGFGVCADTIAVAEDNGVLIEYVGALGKKFQRSKRVPNLTAAMDSDLNIAYRGHKPNEVQKRQEKMLQEQGKNLSVLAYIQGMNSRPQRQICFAPPLKNMAIQPLRRQISVALPSKTNSSRLH